MKRDSILTDDDYCYKELVIRLIDLGFPCHTPHIVINGIEMIQRVSLYEAQKWLRDEKKIHIVITCKDEFNWEFKIYKLDEPMEDYMVNEYDLLTYEDALCSAINKITLYLMNELS